MKFHSKSSPLQVVTALLALVTAQGLWAQSGTNNTTTSVTTSTSTSSASAASFTPPPNINAIISKILAGTELSPTNPAPYDNGTRPNAGQGPVNVQAQYRVNRLVTVDPISNSFTLDIFLRLQWNDPRLVFSENLGQESLRLSPSQIWTPDVYFYNEQGAMNQLDATLKIQNDGTCFWSRHFLMTFGNSFKLQDFPFDQQSLGIQAVSYSFNQNLMNLTFYDDASGGPAFPPVSQTFSSVLWNLQGTTNNATTIVFREGQPLYSLLQFNLQVKRDPTIYILNYILPLFFISFSSCLTYWVDPKIAPARVSFAISLLLSTIAFIFIVSAQLPKVNYPTKLDIYIMMCFGFIFTSLVEFATVHALNRYGYVVLQDSIELTFRFMTPILLILVTGAVFSGSNLVVDGGRVALAVLAAFVICIGISYIVFRVRRDHMKRKKAAAEESAQDDDANNKTAVDGAMFHAVLPA